MEPHLITRSRMGKLCIQVKEYLQSLKCPKDPEQRCGGLKSYESGRNGWIALDDDYVDVLAEKI